MLWKHGASSQPLSRQWYFKLCHDARHVRSQSTSAPAHARARQRRTDFWSPKVTRLSSQPGNLDAPDSVDATALLSRAGFIRQNYAGIYQFLPLGLRVLEKIERLIDKHMRAVGASKVALSSLSSSELWHESGRHNHSEMYKFRDRTSRSWLLAPTHEEEMTKLAMSYVTGPSHLPLRLYQTGRKYRDELRPRGGLLRGREFIMKDLYTFDVTMEDAESTYHEVRAAYRSFFNDIGLPFVEVRADSGNMGGDLSHEYHYPNPAGQDTVITCANCDYTVNEELVPELNTKSIEVEEATASEGTSTATSEVTTHRYSTKLDNDNPVKHSIIVLLPPTNESKRSSRRSINHHMLKAVMKEQGLEIDTPAFKIEDREMDLLPTDDAAQRTKTYYVLDKGVSMEQARALVASDMFNSPEMSPIIISSDDGLSLLTPQDGDTCPNCKTDNIRVQQAIEIGHTFHLGTRYSAAFGFQVPVEFGVKKSSILEQSFVEMGCHGIGVSRLVAAAAACLSSPDKLRWPTAIAPYQVTLLVSPSRYGETSMLVAEQLYDELSDNGADVLIDDTDKALGLKAADAEAIGYPIRVILGKVLERSKVEITVSSAPLDEDMRPRAEDVSLDNAAAYILKMLQQKAV
jgi:prolyl-tRNA synthetase